MRKLLFIAIFFLGIKTTLLSDIQWSPSSLYSSNVHCIKQDGKNLFAGTLGRGILISTDNGSSWVQHNKNLDSTNNINIYSLAIDGKRIYIGTDNGIYISTDYGENWKLSNNGFETNLGYIYIYDIVTNGNKVYASTFYGIYLSKDYGTNWDLIGYDTVKTNKLALSGNNLYVTTEKGLFVTTNDGVNWTTLKSGLYSKSLLIIDSTIYLGTYKSGIYYSSNLGKSWSVRNTNISDDYISDYVMCFAKSGNNVFAGIKGIGVYFSSNSGVSWELRDNGLDDVEVFDLMVFNSTLYCSTSRGGIFYSTDNGNNWTKIKNNNLNTLNVPSIQTNANSIYLLGYEDGVYKSTNYGTAWSVLTDNSPDEYSSFIDAFLLKDSSIFTGSVNIYVSTNDGQKWNNRNTGLALNNFIYSFGKQDNLIIAGINNDIYTSTNNGLTWTEKASLDVSYSIYSIVSNSKYIFCGVFLGGVCRSSDNGNTWNYVNNGLSSLNIRCLAITDNCLLAGTEDNGVFISTDNGNSWKILNSGLSEVNVKSLYIFNSYIFIGTMSDGIYVTSDRGVSWKQINNGLNSLNISSLGILGTYLFAGTSNNGIFQANIDGLNTITKLNISSIDDIIMNQDTVYSNGFTISGSSTGSLQFIISSSNTTLLPIDSIKISGEGTSRTFTLLPVHGDYGSSNITIAVTNGADTAQTSFHVTVKETVNQNKKPYISTIKDIIMNEDTTSITNFTIVGADVNSLILIKQSNNTTLFPSDSIQISGTGTNRILTLAPVNGKYGICSISLIVTDNSNYDTTTFLVTVNKIKPKISSINNIVMEQDTSITISFTVDDDAPNSLQFIKTSSNTVLFPLYSISITGSDKVRYLTLTPVHGKYGSSDITIKVTDGTTDSASTKFNIVVQEKLGVGESEMADNSFITISPNPATQNISLNISNIINIEKIEIRDINGKVIENEFNNNIITNNNLYEFNVSSFPAGIYFFIIKTKTDIISKKFIIE